LNNEPIKVLIVDDSAVIRGLLAKALVRDAEIDVVGTAMHGDAALSWLSKRTADVVILDVEMPVMDGLETLRELQRLHPQVRVIMASSLTSSGAKTSMIALSLGAEACIAKPNAASATEAMQTVAEKLIPLVKGLCGRGPARPSPPPVPVSNATLPSIRKKESIAPPKLLVIGSSTGGPNALNRVLTDLGKDFAVPTLIVQHMPPMFTGMMARHLQSDVGRTVKEAEAGERLQCGVTYVAPGDFHMTLEERSDGVYLALNQEPEEHYCRPSVNPLFRSAARIAGPRTLAVMLTGMGSDGFEGAREIATQGGYLLAQDVASSVVWGMPGTIVNAGLAHEVLPLQEIGSRIVNLCSTATSRARMECS